MNPSLPPDPVTVIAPIDEESLSHMVRRDQLVMLRASVREAIPINLVLSVTAMLVAVYAGLVVEGLLWLALSVVVNVLRHALCGQAFEDSAAGVERQLRRMVVAAVASGSVWALVSLLCAGYTAPQTLFYVAMVCGICAGAVSYGIAYAAVPIGFITPPLLSAAVCFAATGGFDRLCLAAMVVVYFTGLLRAAVQSERGMRSGCRLKNEATAMAAQLGAAHRALQKSTERLAVRASLDALTGLLNREGFTQAATRRIAERPGRPHCLFLFDLDGFKGVNDAFGHQTGDRVLRDVARWLERELDGLGATVGRWGGDEFVVFCDHDDERAQAPAALAQVLIASLPGAMAASGSHMGMSVGIAVARDADVVDMISLADEALYEAKHAGRNRWRLVDDALNKRLAVRRDVERDLLDAIEARAIRLWYQPIVALDSQRVHSLEALLRWDHPSHGRMPPEQVVFAAAGTGLAEALLRYIVEEVCIALRELEALGGELASVPIALNVSPREMAQLGVDRLVLGLLEEEGIDARRLKIEITEEVALDTPAARGCLNGLAAAGVTIVVDDFGVGYSSLASLREHYVRQVKIDRSFVAGLSGSSGNRVLVNAILQLGRALDIEVVAEGVETVDELDVLRALGCRLGQGYHFARPAPLAEVVAWAGRRRVPAG
ncbi:putative bifunctional diguanylate cyclase/phosphodiesterase [Variovorax sp. PvP013]|uniref:putative bifunctional diguanylate cyclase/phosphodiesterase n=1 Tax=Variovorax sp. PvP013 TaxID=3156435 RepID=UPI003D246970